ncbi:zinc finger BED-type containing 8 [Chelydra serpentina]|uniref:Zinc finger BED-type containing 8 n=1 Tax=Chelydra serpentina TaxID=8475 RepID=A0A8T1SYS8_CHESE|nr:zinc finger BED-type containing 8 [Chelydra serpentina]
MDEGRTTTASFVEAAQEIIKQGKPFTDGEYVKECFIKTSEHLFGDFKHEDGIVKKIRVMPLSAKTVKDRTIKMATDVTSQEVSDIRSALGFSIACDETCDVDDFAQVALLGRYINDQGPQEELIALLPLKGQTRRKDIASAVTECLKQKDININRIISIATDGAPSMKGAHKDFFTLKKYGAQCNFISLHNPPGGTVCTNLYRGNLKSNGNGCTGC